MASPDFISDAEMAALFGGAGSTAPNFIADDQIHLYDPSIPEAKTIPSLFDDPLSALTSSDWWLTRPGGERITPGQALVGPVEKVLSGATFGLGDEIISGVSAPVASLASQLTENPLSLGQAYDAALSDVRGIDQSLSTASPVASAALGIGGALKAPLVGAVSKVKSWLTPAETLGQAAKNVALLTGAAGAEGAVYGGAYGFGEGEGGLVSRLDSASDSAVSGAKIGALLGAPISALSEGASLYGPQIREAGENFLRRSVGARASDYSKTAKELSVLDIAEDQVQSATKKALNNLEAKGLFDKARDPSKTLANVLREEKKLGSRVATLIGEADEAGVRAQSTFKRARAYLEEGKVPANQVDDYLQRLDELQAAIQEKGAGRVAYTQQQKIAAGSKYNPDDGAFNGFWRAVYGDLQDAVEKAVPSVKGINRELADIKTTKGIFERALGSGESKNFVDGIFERLRTSGAKTMAGPAVLGAATLGAGAGLPAAAAAGGLGYLATPKGQAQTGKLLRSLASNPAAPIKALEKALPATIPSLQRDPANLSDRDFIASKVDKALDMETPKIIAGNRIPIKVVDKKINEFISKEEGGQKTKAYRPKVDGSGVTVGTGVDLGNRTEYELKHLGLSADLVDKLKPYLGKKDKLADAILERKPLRLTKDEAQELDVAVKADIQKSVSKRLEKSGVELTSLPPEAQTVVHSLAYNFGPALDTALPTIWKAIIANDWGRVQELLRSTKWKQPELKARRLREANLLNPLVTA